MRNCRICGADDFKTVIDFGESPLVNSLLTEEEIVKPDETYPLLVEQCQSCFLVQIVEPIGGQRIYRNQDYLYYSGDMPGLKEYFEKFSNELQSLIIQDFSTPFIVEIGSNDGLMLNQFRHKQVRILGVDPSSNVVVRALKNGIPTISDFFSERLAKSIEKEMGKAKLIGGANCIAHLDDLHDFVRGVNVLLDYNGVFWIECNYWGGMVKNKNAALIYHDHFSYFTLQNWIDFMGNKNFQVFDAYVTPAQGGSLRIFIDRGKRQVTTRMKMLHDEEVSSNLNSYETAVQYEKDVREEATKLRAVIDKIKSEGKTIAGYGAAAKGFSVLQLAGIGAQHIDYFVDDSPAKQGKFTPVHHIPVISREEAEENFPDYFFITAPNYADVIIAKEKERWDSDIKFILVTGEIISTK